MIEHYQKSISGNNQNSYKFALGLAILEVYDDEPKITYKAIAEKVASYYYRNHFRFKLSETGNPAQTPAVVDSFKDSLQKHHCDDPPHEFKKLDKEIRSDCIDRILGQGSRRSFFHYPLPCWTGAPKNSKGSDIHPKKGQNEFFAYDSNEYELCLTEKFSHTINNHRNLLINITIFEWVKFLELFNVTPNLIRKLINKPKRRHQRFTPFLKSLKSNCFLCDKPITAQDFSVDHVIPFNYLYSDDLWNLVPAHRSCNSQKNAKIVSEEKIEELIERNKQWFQSAPTHSKFENILKTYHLKLFDSPEVAARKVRDTVTACLSAGYSRMS